MKIIIDNCCNTHNHSHNTKKTIHAMSVSFCSYQNRIFVLPRSFVRFSVNVIYASSDNFNIIYLTGDPCNDLFPDNVAGGSHSLRSSIRLSILIPNK